MEESKNYQFKCTLHFIRGKKKKQYKKSIPFLEYIKLYEIYSSEPYIIACELDCNKRNKLRISLKIKLNKEIVSMGCIYNHRFRCKILKYFEVWITKNFRFLAMFKLFQIL